MPIDYSGTKASVGKNVKTELAAGKPKKQAVAIALSALDRAKSGKRVKVERKKRRK